MTTTSFPGAIDSFTTKVDGTTDVMADHINYPQTAIVALETYLRGTRDDDNLLACSLTHEASWPTGTTFNDLAHDSYGPALWTVLSSPNAPDVAGIAGGSTDPFTRHFRCTYDFTPCLAGIVQFLSAEKTRGLRGQVVSLSADLWGTGVSNMRMAVVVWTGTADAVTSAITAFLETGNPTLATSWAYIGTPASIAITTTRTRYSVQNLSVPTNANNLGVFVWAPDSESSGDLWNVARVKLQPGAGASDFVARSPDDELARIGRFFEAYGGESTNEVLAPAQCRTSTTVRGILSYKYIKRAAPTITVPDATLWAAKSAGYSNITLTTLSGSSATTKTCVLAADVASGLVAGDATQIGADGNTDARLYLDARL